MPSVFKLEGHDVSTAAFDTDDHTFDGSRAREVTEKTRQKANFSSERGEVADRRTEGILRKAVEAGGRLTLIESVVSSGATASVVMTLTARNVWVEGDWVSGGGALGEDWVMKEDGDGDEVD